MVSWNNQDWWYTAIKATSISFSAMILVDCLMLLVGLILINSNTKKKLESAMSNTQAVIHLILLLLLLASTIYTFIINFRGGSFVAAYVSDVFNLLTFAGLAYILSACSKKFQGKRYYIGNFLIEETTSPSVN